MREIKHIKSSEVFLHKFEEPVKVASRKLVFFASLIIIAGLVSGFGLSYFSQKGNKTAGTLSSDKGGGKKTIVGSADTKIFRDQAEGTLEAGGINGEGTHKLVRSGGESQTVYLTSSVLDLNEFVGRKVRVWGETQAAQKAGWLMDVGRVETIE